MIKTSAQAVTPSHSAVVSPQGQIIAAWLVLAAGWLAWLRLLLSADIGHARLLTVALPLPDALRLTIVVTSADMQVTSGAVLLVLLFVACRNLSRYRLYHAAITLTSLCILSTLGTFAWLYC